MNNDDLIRKIDERKINIIFTCLCIIYILGWIELFRLFF